MDYRCPVCSAHIRRRRLSEAVIVRLETDCPHCKSTIRVNVHRAETIVVLFNFVTIVVLGVSAYWLQSGGLVLLALGAAMAGALALPLVEHYLRDWPRYASMDAGGPEPGLSGRKQ